MASCECCWADSRVNGRTYDETIVEHAARYCVCVHLDVAGQKSRAGQFWDEASQSDTRSTPASPTQQRTEKDEH